jgi:uncharacterized repeat protein (TIGR03803 family)
MSGGGPLEGGTIFGFDPVAGVTTLHSFPLAEDGSAQEPNSILEASDGSLYGTTLNGGTDNWGTIFRLDAAGVLTTIHSFLKGPVYEGAYPTSLMEASDGTFYGRASGVIFRLDREAGFSVLLSLPDEGSSINEGSLLQARDGRF